MKKLFSLLSLLTPSLVFASLGPGKSEGELIGLMIVTFSTYAILVSAVPLVISLFIFIFSFTKKERRRKAKKFFKAGIIILGASLIIFGVAKVYVSKEHERHAKEYYEAVEEYEKNNKIDYQDYGWK